MKRRWQVLMSETVGAKLVGLAVAAIVTGLAVAAAGAAQSGAPNLDRFLMRKGEEPGFRPGRAPGATPKSHQTITGVKAFVKWAGLKPADARRLRSEGFIVFTVAPIRGRKAAGLSNVALYKTHKGAKHSAAHDLRPDVIRSGDSVGPIRYFNVSGVPGARGFTLSKFNAANVLWVQGRCYLTLGNQGPGPLPAALAKGVRAIYKRTHGRCP